MATEIRLIDANAYPCQNCDVSYCYKNCKKFNAWLNNTVDAVPVDKIIFHHILIDENGIPEVKLQFGERMLIIRREDNPVDVREVVHGRWCWEGKFKACSRCGSYVEWDETLGANFWKFCPYCGAKMDGDGNG